VVILDEESFTAALWRKWRAITEFCAQSEAILQI